MRTKTLIIPLAILCSFLMITSCASGPQRSSMRTNVNYQKVFQAAMDSAYDIGFSVASAENKTGRILAEQGVVGGGGKVTRINITVKRTRPGTEVYAVFIQPPGTVSWGDYGIQSYEKAFKARIPGVTITTRQK